MPIPYYTRAEIDMMFGKDPSEVRIVFYTDASPKPVEGTENVLYVDRTNLKAEVWNPTTSEYDKITGDEAPAITYQVIVDALGFVPAEADHIHDNRYYTKTELDAIHATFLTEETDPTVPAHVKAITETNTANWSEAFSKMVNAVSVTGDENKILTITFQDSSTLTASFTDMSGVADGDEYVNSLNFNTTDGVLTVGRTGTLTDITVSLDGRYLTSIPAHTHTWEEITGKPTLVNSVTGTAVDNTDPLNPIINIVGQRFGIEGEDDLGTVNRFYDGKNTRLQIGGLSQFDVWSEEDNWDKAGSILATSYSVNLNVYNDSQNKNSDLSLSQDYAHLTHNEFRLDFNNQGVKFVKIGDVVANNINIEVPFTKSGTIALVEDLDGLGGISEETDPTVPTWVKSITEQNITDWNTSSPFLTAAEFSGLDRKTLTLTQSDDSTITAFFDPVIETVMPTGANFPSFGLREGANTFTSGEDHVVLGYFNTVQGFTNFVTGTYHTVAGSKNNVFGNENKVAGSNHFVTGNVNEITSGTFNSAVFGAYNTIRTMYTAIFGYNNKDRHPVVAGTMPNPDGGNVIGGFNNYVDNGMSMGMFGSGHIQTGNNVTVVGQASTNLNGQVVNVNNPNDARFIVGNGTIASQTYLRQTGSNAFVVYQSGLVVAPTLTSTLIDTQARALVTREYLTAAIAGVGGGSDGVQSVTGHQVDNTDPLNPLINRDRFGNPGEDDIELSNSGRYFRQPNGGHLFLEVGDWSANTGAFWLENNYGQIQIQGGVNQELIGEMIIDPLKAIISVWNKENQNYESAHLEITPRSVTIARGQEIGKEIVTSVNGIGADPEGNVVLPTDGGSDGIQSVTGDAVDNTDPLNPIINFPTPSYMRFAVGGEDDVFNATRAITGNGNDFNLNSVNFNIFHNDATGFSQHTLSKTEATLIVQDKTDGAWGRNSALYLEGGFAQLAFTNFPNPESFDIFIDVDGIRFRDGSSFSVNVPKGKSGTIALIEDLPTGGSGGVQTVTGTGVDNTDPLNPVIDVKDGAFERVVAPYGTSYILEYYTGNNTIEGEGNFIVGANNVLGNGYENYVFGTSNNFSQYAFNNLVTGFGNIMSSSVRMIMGGQINTAEYAVEDGIVVGGNNLIQTDRSAIFGSNNSSYYKNNQGIWNFMANAYNTLSGGVGTSVFGRFNEVETSGGTPVRGAFIMGNAIDYAAWESISSEAPLLLIGNGVFTENPKAITSKSNAFGIANSGEVYAFDLDNAKIAAANGKVLITKEYLEANTGGGGTTPDPTRFGVLGEDDVMSANRAIEGGDNDFQFNNSKLKVRNNKPTYLQLFEVDQGLGMQLYHQTKASGSYSWFRATDTQVYVNRFNGTTSENFSMRINDGGLSFENGFEVLELPKNIGGYLPLKVNGIAADSTGNIVVPTDSGGSNQVEFYPSTNEFPNTTEADINTLYFSRDRSRIWAYDETVQSYIDTAYYDKGVESLQMFGTDIKTLAVNLESGDQVTVDFSTSWDEVTNKPTTFEASSHTHPWSDITGVPTFDNYQSWNLKTNGVQRTTVASGGTLDIVGTGAANVTYGAGGVVTVNVPITDGSGGEVTNILELVNVLDNGVSQDGTDQTANIQALIASDTVLYFPKGTYRVDTAILLPQLNNLTILGDKGTTFTTSGRNIFNTTGDLNNIKFDNIRFISTSTVTTDDYENSLFHCDGHELNRITFEECYFSAPTAQTNGIKMTNQGTKRTDKIRVLRCEFDVLGRMGMELQNHIYDGVSRYSDVWVDDCIFNRVGEIAYGMGVSFSGQGDNVRTTNCTFSNNGAGGSGTAIEYVGCSNSIIDNNIFDNNYKSLLVGGTTYISTENITISNSITIRPDQEGNAFSYVNGLKSINNKLKRYINIHNVQNASFNGDTFESNAYTVFDVENVENVQFYNCRIEQSEDWLSIFYIRGANKNVKLHNTQIFSLPDSPLVEFHPDVTANSPSYNEVDLYDYLTNNLIKTLGGSKANLLTGTVLDLSNVSGNNYNYGTASTATAYTFLNPVVNGFAVSLINAATEPTVTGATKITGAPFEANTDMELVVESKNGVDVRYFLLKL